MCRIIRKSSLPSATGYKVAIEWKGKYRSIWTNVKYGVGKVKPFKIVDDGHVDHFLRSELHVQFCGGMHGKTGVILSKEHAVKELRSFRRPRGLSKKDFADGGYKDYQDHVVLLKMKITGDLYDAEYDNVPTVIGNTIESIRKLKI